MYPVTGSTIEHEIPLILANHFQAPSSSPRFLCTLSALKKVASYVRMCGLIMTDVPRTTFLANRYLQFAAKSYLGWSCPNDI